MKINFKQGSDIAVLAFDDLRMLSCHTNFFNGKSDTEMKKQFGLYTAKAS